MEGNLNRSVGGTVTLDLDKRTFKADLKHFMGPSRSFNLSQGQRLQLANAIDRTVLKSPATGLIDPESYKLYQLFVNNLRDC